MGLIWSILWISATLFSFYLFDPTQGLPFDSYIADNATNITWSNNNYSGYYGFTSAATIKIILLRVLDPGAGSPKFACGFFCDSGFSCDYYVFGIFAVIVDGPESDRVFSWPKVVWSVNRNKLVRENATLILTGDGDLILQDYDGTLVWSTDTKGTSVAGLKLTESGNLVLFDTNNSTVWQSFDHPTDTLLLGQKLLSGSNLTARASSKNLSEGGSYTLSLTNESLSAFVGSDPSSIDYSQTYLRQPLPLGGDNYYAMLLNGSFALYSKVSNQKQWGLDVSDPQANPLQHVSLDFDGFLRVYDWVESNWTAVADLVAPFAKCSYATVCGRYGICSTENDTLDCSCPQVVDNTTKSSYFKKIDERRPSLGCYEINALSCEHSNSQRLVELEKVYQFTSMPDVNISDVESCKLGCLNNCSCKAAMFDSTNKKCSWALQIFSLKKLAIFEDYDFKFFLKVQDGSGALTQPSIAPSTRNFSKWKTRQSLVILGSILGAFSGLLLITGFFFVLLRKKNDADNLEEEYLDQLPGMPNRYSYEDLIATTNNFSKKLGQGGFGSVFEGTLSNGTMVAVKCLDGLGQIKESFLSEVKTISSIHHINLVRLMGYCNNKSHRLLVYEYMCNGSLDKWIFHGSQDSALDWKTRRMVILDIAKGLAYLHDGCSQKILHLDIKPQNILLDKDFRAKVSDFGLSKLIDRDQSQVVTIMKGTPGYLAPEWLNSFITEKVDVYSFGVVVLEILCGRRNLDRSQSEEEMHLLSLFERKAGQDELLDMIDKKSEDMLLNRAEVMKMMKVAAWCLQNDFAKRPSMSAVVKVLEGLPEVEENLEYDFLFSRGSTGNLTFGPYRSGSSSATTSILPSTLSGPR